MKLQRAGEAVVAAEGAAPARLLDQDLLHPTPPCADALRDALRTTALARRDANDSVLPTHVLAVDDLHRASGAATGRSEAELDQPVSDGRVALSSRRRDLADRHAQADKVLQFRPFHAMHTRIRTRRNNEHLFPYRTTC